jgi:hypothetical protein
LGPRPAIPVVACAVLGVRWNDHLAVVWLLPSVATAGLVTNFTHTTDQQKLAA